MIQYDKFTLSNGLRVIHHYDASTPLAVINILYNVGARDEDPEKTGFAHLFEHLMFGGSVNIPSYDAPLQEAGGENNAFTNNDITNYYLTVPAYNIETGFWLESDRMLSLAFSQRSLDVQRNVVIEEFKQRYLNQPYGDVWLKLRPLAYQVHPYRWPTIGKEISHIEQARLDDVKAFFKKFYTPGNAILCVAGNVSLQEVKELSEKWFGPIPPGEKNERNLPAEPRQTEARKLSVNADVPANAIYKAYHCCSRLSPDYYASDLLSDLLSRGRSARLHNALVKEQQLFSDIHAYMSGDLDEGLFIVEGRLAQDISMEAAENAILLELQKMVQEAVPEEELQKVKNKVESSLVFSEMSILNKAMGLCMAELMGDIDLVNTEKERYQAVKAEEIQELARQIFRPENCSTLYYHSLS